jgi:hypothetical protein
VVGSGLQLLKKMKKIRNTLPGHRCFIRSLTLIKRN